MNSFFSDDCVIDCDEVVAVYQYSGGPKILMRSGHSFCPHGNVDFGDIRKWFAEVLAQRDQLRNSPMMRAGEPFEPEVTTDIPEPEDLN